MKYSATKSSTYTVISFLFMTYASNMMWFLFARNAFVASGKGFVAFFAYPPPVFCVALIFTIGKGQYLFVCPSFWHAYLHTQK